MPVVNPLTGEEAHLLTPDVSLTYTRTNDDTVVLEFHARLADDPEVIDFHNKFLAYMAARYGVEGKSLDCAYTHVSTFIYFVCERATGATLLEAVMTTFYRQTSR